MDISELNLKLDKCKKQRDNYNKRLIKRQKFVEYFNIRKNIHLQIIKKFLSCGCVGVLASLSFIFSNLFIANLFLIASFTTLPIIIYQLYVCKKFNKVIKIVENNNKKISNKLEELLQDEFELDMQIKKLSKESLEYSKTTKIIASSKEQQENLSI